MIFHARSAVSVAVEEASWAGAFSCEHTLGNSKDSGPWFLQLATLWTSLASAVKTTAKGHERARTCQRNLGSGEAYYH